ncbi:MAG TPA: hypothetical protein VN688_01570 [Gemmataceae bacterium]|nr:hypothetical protein [Gemmataceae bacterium]
MAEVMIDPSIEIGCDPRYPSVVPSESRDFLLANHRPDRHTTEVSGRNTSTQELDLAAIARRTVLAYGDTPHHEGASRCDIPMR